MKVLDARGLSCPEPVIIMRKAMMSKDTEYEIVVDNVVSRENVTRFAEHQGYKVTVSENNGEYTLSIRK
ncbi:sulfurtransferase TusA family protein [Frisingicoccus sp.]|uniref:sulfurtransferase TusA family protein n=1 Tax=Frisingicoccus sp. TaxID=1918627 RepID=UPI0025C12BBD|nr:sulfurtransferase TusA family protein [Frisingicoccus sp.]MDD6231791.1 sulfurtransferase TusA family protein [Frisingicoccus sp.]MDY4834429.1 sulfurtransferase TusA family protein [Frisingicoccus sp.]MDY4922433.1 sulfurtransferase TusA family protein [Frisingicoccus sp.]